MGTLDILKELEGRVLDAASFKLLERNYELQEENHRQLSTRVETLEREKAELQATIARLSLENAELKETITIESIERQFLNHQGFAFRRLPGGGFEEAGYCPNCRLIMSNTSPRNYQCRKCSYSKRSITNPDVIARQLTTNGM